MGLIFTILGIYTSSNLWSNNTGLAVITIIATLYQVSSLNEMFKEKRGIQTEDKVQTVINMASSLIIVVLFMFSFLTK